MSEEQGTTKPSGQAPPLPALARQAPGVKDAGQARESALGTGDLIGGKFLVSRVLGSSDGATNYLCRDQSRDRDVVLKLIPAKQMRPEQQQRLAEDVKLSAKLGSHRNLTSVYGMGQTPEGQIFVVQEFVDGASLSRLIAERRERKQKLSMRDVFTVLAHLAYVLEVVHKHMAHGVLTPYNVYVTSKGSIKLTNLAFGHAASLMLHEQGKGAYHDSIYIAPELARDPHALTPRADIYSLAMIAIELLKPDGLPADRQLASRAVSAVMAEYPPRLTQMLLTALDIDPDKRPTLVEFLQIFEDTARAMGATLGHPPTPDELPIEPAVAPESLAQMAAAQKAAKAKAPAEDEDDIFNIPLQSPDRSTSFGVVSDQSGQEARYLVQKDGLDYGPFTVDQVLEQLRKDEIDERTQVLDRFTQDRVALIEVPDFTEAVKAYIPEREERRRREAAARAELQRKVKKGGLTVFYIGIVAGLFVLAGMIYVVVNQPDPEPLPMDKAFASLDFKLLPPPKDFQTVAVDSSLMKSIFDPKASEEEIANKLKALKKKRRAQGSGSGKAGGAEDENVTEIDMSAGAKDGRILSDGEINEIIMVNFGSLRRCIVKELGSNPGFKRITIQFFVRPSGTTGGVKVLEANLADKEVGRCVIDRFRQMKFPAHSGFNKGVTFPIQVQ